MGSLQNVIGMLPGMPKEVRNAEIDDREIAPDRGDHPVDDARGAPQARSDQRVAPRRASRRAAGVNTADVNNLLKQFKQVQQMMRAMGGGAQGQEGQAPEAADGRPSRPSGPADRTAEPRSFQASRRRDSTSTDRSTSRSCCWPSRSV